MTDWECDCPPDPAGARQHSCTPATRWPRGSRPTVQSPPLYKTAAGQRICTVQDMLTSLEVSLRFIKGRVEEAEDILRRFKDQ